MGELLDLDLTTNHLDALNLDSLTPETSDADALAKRVRLLRFPLGSEDSVLLPLEQIIEILRVDIADILAVPETPSCVLGLCNWRGEMLWLIDLNHFVGYRSPFEQESVPASLMVMAVEVNHQAIGLGVPQVNDVELHDLQQLQPVVPGLFSPNFQPFVLGTLPGCSDAVFDLRAIAQSSLWGNPQRENP